MQKIVIHRAGGFDRLRLEEHPRPVPAPGEVLVRIEAAGVNYADTVVRRGLYASAREFVGWPITPGFEFAGIVEAVGPGDDDDVQPGDHVVGVSRFGAYATHVSVPRHQLFPLPAGLTFEQAAAFPVAFLTAYHAIFQNLVPAAGGTALVHSAAGGVGSALLQLGRIAGYRMVGVVGAGHKVDVARRCGADEVIDTSVEDLWDRARQCAPAGYDAVFDANGVSTLRGSYDHLRPTGKLVVYGFASMLPRGGGRTNHLKLAWDYIRTPRFNPLRMTSANRSVIAFNLSFLFDRPDLLLTGMQELLRWLADGQLLIPPLTVHPLADAGAAHRAIESGQSTGKLVLTTSSHPARSSGDARAQARASTIA